jgi:hypothetical protein
MFLEHPEEKDLKNITLDDFESQMLDLIKRHRQPERLNPEDKNWFGMKAEIRKDRLCYFEDGTIVDPTQPIDVCDSLNSENK